MKCPVCEAQDWREVVDLPSLLVRRCSACGFHVGDHRRNVSAGEYDRIWQEAGPSYVDLLGALREKQAGRWDRLLRRAFGTSGKIVDFGAGRGWFVKAMSRRGWSVHGCDASVEALAYLDREGIPTSRVRDFRELPKLVQEAKILTALDVLEHFKADDLGPFLAVVKSLPGLEGILFKVPRSKGFFFLLSRFFARLGKPGPWEQLWQVGTFPPHEVYFDETSLRALLEKHGFEILGVAFDADFEPSRLLARIVSLPPYLRWLDAPVSFTLWCFVSLMGRQDSVVVWGRPRR